jgi:hypothetical protein
MLFDTKSQKTLLITMNNSRLENLVLETIKGSTEPPTLEMADIASKILDLPNEAFEGQERPSKIQIGHAIFGLIQKKTLDINSRWKVVLTVEVPKQ